MVLFCGSVPLRDVLTAIRRGVSVQAPPRRHVSSSAAHLNIPALDAWIRSDKTLLLSDTLRTEHLSDLYVTLPTRDGTLGTSARLSEPPRTGAPLGYGHHLAFFHPRNPESALRPDGTDSNFCPPEPFTRRMWAGGKIVWNNPLLIGEKVLATSTIVSVEKKGFEKGFPMVFVKQRIEYRMEHSDQASIEEERSHVYLASPGNRRQTKEVQDLPAPQFSFQYTPSATTLFRFSALTFNGHHIHLDKEFAQLSEGYPERLVHGPLTALMLLEVYSMHAPDSVMRAFEYRAVNPLVVNRSVTINGTKSREESIVHVWAEDTETKVVGIVGRISM